MGNACGKLRCRWMRGAVAAAASVCVWSCEAPSARAQTAPAAQEDGPNSRLLTLQEGRAIVNAAWEQDEPRRGTQDCSHLVHRIYHVAGFEYSYASSYEIYAGAENFERVRYPQAGDLVVWPGHVGIVVDPLQHSFYSLVRSGLEAQDYQGPYWRSRGRPRFYRYKVSGQEILSAASAPVPPKTPRTSGQRGEAPTVEGRSIVAASSPNPNRPPRAASERTAVFYGPMPPEPAEVEATAVEIPPSIIIAAGNKPPTRDEVAEGISELSSAAGNVLRASDPSKLQTPLVIFERLSVERVEIKRDHGWARLQLETRASLAGGGTDLKRRHEKVRWELRRTDSGWEAVKPADRTYVPRDVAVKNLAGQLARLTESGGAAAHQETVLRQESQLASLLSALLENK